MEPVATTHAGKVRGRADDGALAFLGVPFAAPPFGEHRLLAPAPPVPWDGERPALAYGPTSQQPDDEIVGGVPEPSIAGEDILTVNVFTPDLGGAGLPVLVWIHGGGFYAGSPASPWYRGTRFARDGVVVVTVGYRLGAEGFAAFAGGPANRAVLDWLAALEWVQRNIAGFGGDPGRVTVAGQSAGAVAVTTLLSMPRAAGLFERAISMSGVARAVPVDEADATAATLAGHMGVAPTWAEVAARPFADLHAAQQALRAGQGLALLEDRRQAMGQMPFAPVIDGDLVPGKPLKAIAGGAGGAADLLAGATHHETNFGVSASVPTLDEAGLLRALTGFGLPADDYRALHAHLTPPDVLGQAITDRMFRSRVQSLAEARAAAGGAGHTFTYDFRWPSALLDGQVGAAHCIDIPFVFDNLDAEEVDGLAGPEPPQALADLVHGAWVRFVTSGDPGWPAHDLDHRTTMVFDVESGPVDDLLAAERVLWAGGAGAGGAASAAGAGAGGGAAAGGGPGGG
jgi:para-nitrobenzyl esterase